MRTTASTNSTATTAAIETIRMLPEPNTMPQRQSPQREQALLSKKSAATSRTATSYTTTSRTANSYTITSRTATSYTTTSRTATSYTTATRLVPPVGDSDHEIHMLFAEE
jgi:hypothetical protein